MLTKIEIKGLAIIESLDIDFSSGFNVITGETGAGKSILIKALGYLLGGKASSDAVRKGCTSASICGTFSLPASHATQEVVEDVGIPIEFYKLGSKKHFDILVRRSISAKGRSGAWINDVPVTITKLKEFADRLIDIFAQHENHRLLDPALHTLYVDQFLSSKKTKKELGELHSGLIADAKRLEAMATEFRERQRDADYLRFRHKELADFDPSIEDYGEIKRTCELAQSHSTIRNGISAAAEIIDAGAGGSALSSAVWEAVKQLEAIDNPEIEALRGKAQESATALDDLSFEIGKCLSNLDIDDADVESAQERLASYQELMRKMASRDIDELMAEYARLCKDLDFLESASRDVTDLLSDMADRAKTLTKLDTKLLSERSKAAGKLKKAIDKELHDLAMPGASMSVRFEANNRVLAGPDLALFGDKAIDLGAQVFEALTTITSQGSQRACFYLGSNKGEGESALHKVASGGEVSRIMLGFKRALSAGADTCILVFDEIDSGISGRVADVVGQKLNELAHDFQVICISHLAQVAAYADTHFRVAKVAGAKRTESSIEKLSKKESQDEIARLLSGDEVTKSSLANAKQLIRKAREKSS